jgi:hypothetical protein
VKYKTKMNHTEQRQHVTSVEGDKSTVKRPYIKPEVRHEPVFETMALTCGKNVPTQMNCQMNWKSS